MNLPDSSPQKELPAAKETWHVIEAARLMALLRRARAGENPDLLYIEEYVNAEREAVDG